MMNMNEDLGSKERYARYYDAIIGKTEVEKYQEWFRANFKA